jgi:hypothetical protein
MVFANSQDLTYGYGVFDTYGVSSSTGTTSATNSQSYTISSPGGVITVGAADYASGGWYVVPDRGIRVVTSSGTSTNSFFNYSTSNVLYTPFTYYNEIIYIGDSEEVKKERERKDREEERLKKNALFRGTKLLESLLPQLEYKKFQETKALEVVTNDFLYKLQLGEKVRRVNKITGKEERLCIVPKKGSLPDIDKLIGFKLLIEADEEYFNKTANVLNW